MKVAFFSDAHGNPIALEACFRAMDTLGVEARYFLGDAIGYLDGATEVLEMLRASGAPCQKGNHDAMLLGELPIAPARERVYRITEARAQCASADLEMLATWPAHRELEFGGLRILLAHGSPAPSITEYVWPDTPIVLPPDFAFDMVFLGHTHRPFVRQHGAVTVVNCGSSGLPRDRGDLASFALLDTHTRGVRVMRVPFDRDHVLATIGACAAPEVRDVLHRQQPFFGEQMVVS